MSWIPPAVRRWLASIDLKFAAFLISSSSVFTFLMYFVLYESTYSCASNDPHGVDKVATAELIESLTSVCMLSSGPLVVSAMGSYSTLSGSSSTRISSKSDCPLIHIVIPSGERDYSNCRAFSAVAVLGNRPSLLSDVGIDMRLCPSDSIVRIDVNEPSHPNADEPIPENEEVIIHKKDSSSSSWYKERVLLIDPLQLEKRSLPLLRGYDRLLCPSRFSYIVAQNIKYDLQLDGLQLLYFPVFASVDLYESVRKKLSRFESFIVEPHPNDIPFLLELIQCWKDKSFPKLSIVTNYIDWESIQDRVSIPSSVHTVRLSNSLRIRTGLRKMHSFHICSGLSHENACVYEAQSLGNVAIVSSNGPSKYYASSTNSRLVTSSKNIPRAELKLASRYDSTLSSSRPHSICGAAKRMASQKTLHFSSIGVRSRADFEVERSLLFEGLANLFPAPP